MERQKAQRKRGLLVLAAALLMVGGASMWSTWSRYYPSPMPERLPEATAQNGLPPNPREHLREIMEELDLTAGQWLELARVGPPRGGTRAEREAHGERIAEILNEDQRARLSNELLEIHHSIFVHMMSKLSPEDQEAMVRRLARHPDSLPGPPRSLMAGARPEGGPQP